MSDDLFQRAIIDKLSDLKQRVADLTAQESIKLSSTGLPYFPALTTGSVLFAGSGGLLSQDNANLFWDDTNDRLGIGNAAPAYTLDVSGVIHGKSDLYLTKGSSPFVGTVDNFDLRFGVNLNEILRLTTTGAVETTGALTAKGTITNPITDAGTTNAVVSLLAQHLTSGTPAAGFGLDWIAQAHSNTNTTRSLLQMRSSWATATDASRKARTDFILFDTAARTALRLEASGTAAMIGFLGAGAVVRRNITGTRTGTLAQLQTVVANLLTGLANLGVITDSTA